MNLNHLQRTTLEVYYPYSIWIELIVLLNQNGKGSLLQHSVHNTTPNVCYECAHGLEQHSQFLRGCMHMHRFDVTVIYFHLMYDGENI